MRSSLERSKVFRKMWYWALFNACILACSTIIPLNQKYITPKNQIELSPSRFLLLDLANDWKFNIRGKQKHNEKCGWTSEESYCSIQIIHSSLIISMVSNSNIIRGCFDRSSKIPRSVILQWIKPSHAFIVPSAIKYR